jgi:CRISPR-associated endonuclease Cas3-HD
VFPYTLQKWVGQWLEAFNASSDDELTWAVKYLHQPDRSEANAGLENAPRYQWIDAPNAKSVLGAGLVVVNPKLASYDPVLGFRPDVPTADVDMPAVSARFRLPEREKRQDNSDSYRLETYEDHIAHVYRAAFGYRGAWWEMADTAVRLERFNGWEPGSLRRAAELAVLLHDVGKLSVKWQRWVRDYQQRIGQPAAQDKAYAHTDFDWREDTHKTAQQQTGRRPWHAVESAWAVSPLLASLGDAHMARAVYSAIARHHAARSTENEAYRLIPTAMKHIAAALTDAETRVPGSVSPELHTLVRTATLEGARADVGAKADSRGEVVLELNDAPTHKDVGGYLAYWLLVRVLRLADQQGTREGAKNF